MNSGLRFHIPFLALALSSLAAPQAWAHRDDYIDETFVYQTLGSQEREIEGWAEIHAGHDRHPRAWYTGAFEYGVTKRWTVDGAAQWVHDTAGLGLGRFRSETPYRFAEEGQGPLDFAVSLEYEAETRRATKGETEHVLTPRLVVSRDLVPAFNTTLKRSTARFSFPSSGSRFRTRSHSSWERESGSVHPTTRSSDGPFSKPSSRRSDWSRIRRTPSTAPRSYLRNLIVAASAPDSTRAK